jgi:CDP-diacylglycerol--glycerol-3-phosphate 3-phosphatidyltransferase
MNLPNKITVTRIALVLVLLLGLFVLYFIPNLQVPLLGESGINVVYLIACIVFLLASMTDYLDGHIARKYHLVTDLGKFLDPVADKMLVDSMLIYLCLPHFLSSTLSIPLWCVIIMILRDLVVDALRFVAASKGCVLAANIFGKIKTVAQMVAIPFVLLNDWPFSYFDASWGAFRVALLFVYIATLASLLSGVIYLWQNRKVLKEGNHD